jgi:hypothetical protein
MTKPNREDVYGAIAYGTVGVAALVVGGATHEALLTAAGSGLVISAVPAWFGLRPWLRGRKARRDLTIAK